MTTVRNLLMDLLATLLRMSCAWVAVNMMTPDLSMGRKLGATLFLSLIVELR